MIGLDLQQETPASPTGLIVEPKNTNDGTEKLSFATLLTGLKDGDKLSDLNTLLKGLQSKDDTQKPTITEERNSSLLKKISSKNLENMPEDLKNSKSSKFLEGEKDTFIGEQKKSSKVLNLIEPKSSIETSLKIEEIEALFDNTNIELNSQLTKSLSSEDLKALMKDAKTYLKNQILSSEGFKKSEIETLPKTLKGLTQAAQKLGLDLSKITLEDIQPKEETEVLSAENKKKRSTELKATSPSLFQNQKDVKISTEQMVQAKSQNSQTLKTNQSKKRSDETLQLLLQGKETTQKDPNLTSDFTLETARVRVSSSSTIEIGKSPEQIKSLESLLNPEISKDNKSDILLTNKTDSSLTQISKADSLEVKMNEAKQMVKYLSQDVKQAIDDYKAPFTRVKVQLNPQQLGEVELTVVQRGKNLHVNLSSNNAAINTLAMNANDLKVQLQNNGINNASLNFSNNSQGGEAANGGQSNQQQQNRQQAQQEYNYFESEEQNEEILSSLEIIVPNYA